MHLLNDKIMKKYRHFIAKLSNKKHWKKKTRDGFKIKYQKQHFMTIPQMLYDFKSGLFAGWWNLNK